MSTPITKRQVHFQSRGINVVGDLYIPQAGAPDRQKAGIVIGHPGTGVKEQTAGLYARELAGAGFVTLAWDAAYQGESGGEPRDLEDPYQRVEDVKSAVSYLATSEADIVDPDRIGALGICVSGGYVPFAAQTDVRIRAVATISAGCLGQMMREGMTSGGPEARHQALIQAGRDRNAEAKGEAPRIVQIIPDNAAEIPDGAPPLIKEGFGYYKTSRGAHPRSTNVQVARSFELMLNYDSFAFIDMISPRPLLMIAGSEAASREHSEVAIGKAREPKEMFVVPGKGHVDLYDDISVTVPKITEFMVGALVAAV
ncbi:X-Pro dipeptidyl-peptidase protein [Thozetella sp. PMI_491]|nr:X-Pro dipeptidyl-peptidase protein [Thozetella sp. PMI_491]